MKRFLVALAWMGIPAFLEAAPTVVTVSGRQLRVNNQPFTIRGVNYSPTPVGNTKGATGARCLGPYQWWTDRAAYRADFPLIKKMGANTLRTYDTLNSVSSAASLRAALDEASAQGLYVILSHYPSHTATLDAAFKASVKNDILAAVDLYKDHPAVLMWAIGNEQNIDNGNGPGWYQFLEEVASAIKARDPNHPVMTVEGECPSCTPAISFHVGDPAFSADDLSLPSLDVWGITAYRGPSFGTLFEDIASKTSKPILVAEFGKDAYRDALAREDAGLQAGHLYSQWSEIAASASAADAAQPLIGGVVFEWTDEWWKISDGQCDAQGTGSLFSRPADTADPLYNEEWFGLASIFPIDARTNPAGTARSLRQGYYTLQRLWAPAVAAGGTSRALLDGTVRNFPNPFLLGRQSTKFVVSLRAACTVNFSIYDAGGAFVASLAPVNASGPGRWEVLWDGRDRTGGVVSAGLYHVRIEARSPGQEETQFRRVVAVR